MGLDSAPDRGVYDKVMASLLVAMAAFGADATANVRYVYTAEQFLDVTVTSVPDTLPPRDAVLSTSDAVSGYIEFDAPLAPNAFYEIRSDTAVAFRFTDGQNVFDAFDRLDSGSDFLILETDANGEVFSWFAQLRAPITGADATGARELALDSDATFRDEVRIIDCLDPGCSTRYEELAVTGGAGAFSGPEPVSETPAPSKDVPFPAAMLGVLAGGILAMARRSVRRV